MSRVFYSIEGARVHGRDSEASDMLQTLLYQRYERLLVSVSQLIRSFRA